MAPGYPDGRANPIACTLIHHACVCTMVSELNLTAFDLQHHLRGGADGARQPRWPRHLYVEGRSRRADRAVARQQLRPPQRPEREALYHVLIAQDPTDAVASADEVQQCVLITLEARPAD